MYKKHIKIAHQGTLDVLLIKVANIEQQCVSIRPQLREQNNNGMKLHIEPSHLVLVT